MKSLSHRVRQLAYVSLIISGVSCAWGDKTCDTTVLEERSNMWTRIVGSAVLDIGTDATVDNAGNGYLAGYTEGAFEGQTNAGRMDECLLKYAADGALVWARIWGSTNQDAAMKTALDRGSNIYVAGTTAGSYDGQTNANEGTADFCISKFTPDGVRAWTRIWGSTNTDTCYGLAVDDLTNIYVAGYTYGSFDGQTNAGLTDMSLTKFNAAGERQWVRIWGSVDYDYAVAVAFEPPSSSYMNMTGGGLRAASNVYIAGYTTGAFDGQTNAGGMDACLIKITADGARAWTRIWGSPSNDYGMAVALDPAGDVYAYGDSEGNVGGQTNNGEADCMLAKFNNDGAQTWVKLWGSASNDFGYSLVCDKAGNPCVGGMTAGAWDGQTNQGGYDLYLTKLNSGGTRAWTQIWGSPLNEVGRAVAQDSVGHLWVAGYTEGAFDGQTNAGFSDLCMTKWGFTAPGMTPCVYASDGAYTYKVLLSWGAATNAFGYRVWRNTANDAGTAEELGNTISAAWYDYDAVPGTLYYYWVKATNDAGLGAISVGESGWRRSQASTDNAPSDMDGDRRKDPTVYQQTTGEWLIMLSGNHYAQQPVAGFGGAGYRAVTGDYDGDSKTDPAVYQEATGLWMVMLSGDHYNTAGLPGFGNASFTPVPADYDGDGRTDPAIYQEATGTWIVKMSQRSYAEASMTGFGGYGAQPVFGDFDGDGKNDPAVYIEATGTLQVLMSANNYQMAAGAGIGGPGYLPVHGDFDSDRKADPAFYQESSGTWVVLMSVYNYSKVSFSGFGGPGYTALAGDYDQDYKADPAVYQRSTGNWQIMLSGNQYEVTAFGGFGGGSYAPVP